MRLLSCSLPILLFSFKLWAAPIPLTSSSIFISAKNGLYQSHLGFSLHLAKTNWVQIAKPADNPYIETVYRASHDGQSQAALTVRVEKLSKPSDPLNYAQKWLKDYPRFGFDILSSKRVKIGTETGYLIDMVNNDNAKQLRQVLFVKNLHAVTLTCRDDISDFSQTLKSCNEIIKTFQW